MAEPLHDRRRVPWLANAIAVERSARQRLRHQRRRQDDDFDVAFGVDAAGGEPVAQFVVVARIGMDDGEARSPLRNRSDGRRKGCAVRGCVQGLAGAMIEHPRPERVRHRDGVAAQPERHRRDRARRQRGEAEIAGDRHRRQHMRDLEMPDREPVTDIRPRAFARELERDALVFREALRLRDDEDRAVEQRHEAGGDFVRAHGAPPGSRSPAAVMRLSAISASLRFWFIAALRMRR